MIGIGINHGIGIGGGGFLGILAYYVDPSAGSVGDGSYASPWDDFTEINALTLAQLDGAFIRVKSGQTVYDGLWLQSRDGFTIETYGGSAQAIIDGTEAASYTWTNPTGLIWRTTTPGAAVGLFIDGVATRFCNTAAQLDNTDFGWFYGNYSALGTALYVRLPSGVDPTVAPVRIARAENLTPGSLVPGCAIRLTGCSGFTLQNVNARRGRLHVVNVEGNVGAAYSDFTIDGNTFEEAGYYSGGCDLLNIMGSSGYRATNGTITNNVLKNNVTSDGNNGCNALEFNHVDGMTARGNRMQTFWGNGVELYRNCRNVLAERNRILDFGGRAWWVPMITASQQSQDNTFRNNICISLGNHHTMRSNWGGSFYNGPNGITHDGGDRNLAYNNTFVLGDAAWLSLAQTASGGDGTLTARNNLVVKIEPTTNSNATVAGTGRVWSPVADAPDAAKEFNLDYNRYYQRRRGNFAGAVNTRTAWAGSTAYSLGAFVSISGSSTIVLECTTAGTSHASSEPTSGSAGTTVTDGTVTWTRRDVALTTLATWQAADADLDAHSSHGNPTLTAILGAGSQVLAVTVSGNVAAAQNGLVTTSAAHGRSVGDWVSMPTTGGSSAIAYSRIAAVPSATTFVMEYQVYGSQQINSGAAITYYPNWAEPDVTPTDTALRSGGANRGIGSGTDANVPTVDYAGTARPSSSPCIGAIEV